MAKVELVETVCPSCSRSFELPVGTREGTCPNCNAVLRFMAEETPVAVATVAPVDPAPPSTNVSVEPGPGEFRVQCPACATPFNAVLESHEAACPHCGSALVLEDRFAERGVEYPVRCPNCQELHEVPLASTSGACPRCGARLEYEDVFPAPVELRVATRTSSAPPVAPDVATPAIGAVPGPAGPAAVLPPQGFPQSVDCPSCKRGFAVPAGAHEGACPHCSTPLAFVSEREFEALQVAEERKKQVQERLATKRLQQKQRELERQKAAEEERLRQLEVAQAAGEGERVSFQRRALAMMRLGRKSQAEAGPSAPPAEISAELEPITDITAPAAPKAPPTRRLWRRTPPKAAPPTTTVEELPSVSIEIASGAPKEPPAAKGTPLIESIVELPPLPDVVASTEEVVAARPPGAPTERKGLLSRLRRPKPAPPTGPAASIEIDAIDVDAASPPAAIETEPIVVEAPPSPPPKPSKRSRSPPAPVEIADIAVDASPATEASFDLGGMEVSADATPPPKSRERRPEAPVAVVETSDVVVESTDLTPSIDADTSFEADAAPTKKKARKR